MQLTTGLPVAAIATIHFFWGYPDYPEACLGHTDTSSISQDLPKPTINKSSLYLKQQGVLNLSQPMSFSKELEQEELH